MDLKKNKGVHQHTWLLKGKKIKKATSPYKQVITDDTIESEMLGKCGEPKG